MSSHNPAACQPTDRDGATRREFLANLAAAAASTAVLGAAANALADTAPAAGRKIKLGVVGCGGRGAWIANFFQQHGGYEMHALADYFQNRRRQVRRRRGRRRKTTIHRPVGIQESLESGVEAIVIIDIPYFYAEQAQAAIDAGCHVYMAKPVAVDVPGCLAIEAAAKQATEKKLCFHVDYQMPTDPVNIEIVRRIWDGGLGKILSLTTWGGGGGSGLNVDAPREKTLENVFQGLRWLRDIALGCDMIGNFDIHSIDAAMWATARFPWPRPARLASAGPIPSAIATTSTP